MASTHQKHPAPNVMVSFMADSAEMRWDSHVDSQTDVDPMQMEIRNA